MIFVMVTKMRDSIRKGSTEMGERSDSDWT